MSDPKWLEIAKGEIGTKEVDGSGENPRIREYLESTTYPVPSKNADSVAWCSAFVNWCMEQAGVRGTGSAAAASWRKWGQELEEGRLGCVVVMRRQGGNHVGFYLSENEYGVSVLGGNQSDAVNVRNFAWGLVTNFRWPEEE